MSTTDELKVVLEPLDEQDSVVVRARESLDRTLADLKLTPEEEAVLGDELRQLRELTEKLDAGTIEIAAFGMVSRGKSSVLNASAARTSSRPARPTGPPPFARRTRGTSRRSSRRRSMA